MKLFYPALFILLFFIRNVSFPEVNSADSEVLSGLDDVYNLRFDDAEKKFKNIQAEYPSDLKGFFFESLLYFYKALPSRNEEMFDRYMDMSEYVILKAEKILDKDEDNSDALYYKGMSHSYRSLLMLTLNKNLLKAASDGNAGYRILEDLTKREPGYYDAYMGLGLYKIAIGFVPAKFRWLLSLIGIEGNIYEGLSLLKKSMEKGKFTCTDSKVFLCLFSVREKDNMNNTSLKYSYELSQSFPSSPVFKILYSGILLQSGKNDESIQIANEAASLNIFSFRNDIMKSVNALLATAYFRKNDFQTAVKYYEECFKYIVPQDRFNVHFFSAGTAYEMTGNRAAAIEKYKMAKNNFINERDGELDKLFYRYAQSKIKEPMSELEKYLVIGMNLRESMKIEEAISFYNNLISDNNISFNSDDDKIRFYFDLGLAYSFNKDYESAIKYFDKCLKLNPENEKWFLPNSCFELGKIYDRKGNSAKSREMFDNIFEYEDYDLESFLQMRLSNYLNNKF